jgi:prepilin-type processing-associated H-X9-DG protein
VNNLGQIGLGIFSYQDEYRFLPPARQRHRGAKEQPMCSWRVLLTPKVSGSTFYSQYRQDEAWSSANNLKLSRYFEYFYHCPSDPSARQMTNYVAVVGQGTTWPGETPCRSGEFVYRVPFPELPQKEPRMTMGPDRWPDFSKGTSNTLLVVECANSGIHWMEPRDLEFDRLDFTVNGPARVGRSGAASSGGQGVSSEHSGGANALFTDGHVGFVSANVAPEVLKGMLTIGGGKSP